MLIILPLLGAIAMMAVQWLIYVYAPEEATMGVAQKIFYLHLPLAWWALISFFMAFAGSIFYLLKKKITTDCFCQGCVELGLLFASAALITGMIWGKKAWGVWWTWDPRLTTTLIMWFIYCGWLLIRHLDFPPVKMRKICAALGILAFLDVPLVFFSARIFRSIHPAVFASGEGGMESEMLTAAIYSVVATGIFWCAMLFFRYRQLVLMARCKNQLLKIASEYES